MGARAEARHARTAPAGDREVIDHIVVIGVTAVVAVSLLSGGLIRTTDQIVNFLPNPLNAHVETRKYRVRTVWLFIVPVWRYAKPW